MEDVPGDAHAGLLVVVDASLEGGVADGGVAAAGAHVVRDAHDLQTTWSSGEKSMLVCVCRSMRPAAPSQGSALLQGRTLDIHFGPNYRYRTGTGTGYRYRYRCRYSSKSVGRGRIN